MEKYIENLREYINEDDIYTGKAKIESDFDNFCYNHCKDIDDLLKAYKKAKNEYLKLHERNNDLERALVDEEYRLFLLKKCEKE